MSESEFQKCSCQKCGGHIEFPTRGLGLMIDCPHCGEKTILSRLAPAVYPAEPAPVSPRPPIAPSVPARPVPTEPLTSPAPPAPARPAPATSVAPSSVSASPAAAGSPLATPAPPRPSRIAPPTEAIPRAPTSAPSPSPPAPKPAAPAPPAKTPAAPILAAAPVIPPAPVVPSASLGPATPPTSVAQKAGRKPVMAVALAIVAILAVGGVGVGYLKWRESKKAQDLTRAPAQNQTTGTPRTPGTNAPDRKSRKTNPPAPSPSPSPATPIAAPSPPPAPASIPNDVPPSNDRIKPTRPPEKAKAITDFGTGGLKLEKATGSSLVYALGSLTNNSSHQRYGVRVEIALTDANGKPTGVARDYRPVLEPGEIWRFRALILDSRAKVATIKEVMEDP